MHYFNFSSGHYSLTARSIIVSSHSSDCWLWITIKPIIKDLKLKASDKGNFYEISGFEIHKSYNTNTVCTFQVLLIKHMCHFGRTLLRSWSNIPAESSKSTHGTWSPQSHCIWHRRTQLNIRVYPHIKRGWFSALPTMA